MVEKYFRGKRVTTSGQTEKLPEGESKMENLPIVPLYKIFLWKRAMGHIFNVTSLFRKITQTKHNDLLYNCVKYKKFI